VVFENNHRLSILCKACVITNIYAFLEAVKKIVISSFPDFKGEVQVTAMYHRFSNRLKTWCISIGKIDGFEKVGILSFAPISVEVFYCQISISAIRVNL
jgi:hypothetical protein